MTTWTAGPHGPIEQLADNLWRVEAPLKSPPIPRVMAVARRADGDLVVHSAIALCEADMERLDALGPVRFLLVPNGYHRIDAPAYKRRYPAARVLCPRPSRERVAQVVPVDGAYEDLPADRDVRLDPIDGTGGAEGALIVRSPDGFAIVVNDIIFNMQHRSGLSGFVLRHLTRSTGGPRVSRLARLALVKDAAALRAHLLRLAETADLRRLVVSHGDAVLDDAAGALRQAAATL